jgi:hypothetical protein
MRMSESANDDTPPPLAEAVGGPPGIAALIAAAPVRS